MRFRSICILLAAMLSCPAAFGRDRVTPRPARFSLGLTYGFVADTELMSEMGVTGRMRISALWGVGLSYAQRDYLFETDCGHHRNNAEVVGTSAYLYPFGSKLPAWMNLYLKGGLLYLQHHLGATDWDTNEEVNYDTKAFNAEFGGGVAFTFLRLPGGVFAMSLFVEAGFTYPIIEPGAPKCACDCIELPTGKSGSLKAGLAVHF